MNANNIVNLTAQNAKEVLIDQAEGKVVLIDFWADWCEPCKQLLPILEKIAADYSDNLILAKVDCEAEQALAGQFQIRNLPTLMVFKDGQPVDGLAGAQPEQAIREMLSKHLPQPEDDALKNAKEALANDDADTAYTQAKLAVDLNPTNHDAVLVLAHAAAKVGHTEQAKELLAQLSISHQSEPEYQQVQAIIQLAEEAADSPEIRALEEQVKAAPDDLALQSQLSVQYFQVKRYEEALAMALTLWKAERSNDEFKKHLLDMINNLPEGDPLASTYRKKVYSMLY
ncbi:MULTISPECIES: thioredoxin [Gammaproteobacteria]|uniref:thioredoxin n=1 Tax=Gammaproteobacteria TaxID=1236 RepID=UPI000DCFD9A3|nr:MULTISPECIES: thioredoxin [Gammaproteobacteria]RTE87744.1 thioredoxin [Aliidiomarina sp. B3213]TCZ92474.1 thioredoxin [Lysobacter sp. N42]